MNRAPIRAGPELPANEFEALRRRLCLEHSKWDPQVGDVGTLARFPLILSAATWRQLSEWSESLARELLAAEHELAVAPAFFRQIGLSRQLRGMMGAANDLPRVVRFDFHATSQGWRISEANSDVPGGFNEGSILPQLVAEVIPDLISAGDPRAAWGEAVAQVADGRKGVIALASAPGFMEDAQVVAGLATTLVARGLDAKMCGPRNLLFDNSGGAMLWGQRVAVIVRFVQAEWLPSLCPQWRSWWTTHVPVLNPPTAAMVESKRLPLVWDKLVSAMPVWRQLLPATADPREVPWRTDEWIVKPAYGNTGDDVACVAWTEPREWRRIVRRVRLRPRSWVAQRRFEVIAVDTPIGECRPCIGVFAIGGRVAGAYGRLVWGHIVDYQAIDAAVLIEPAVEKTETSSLAQWGSDGAIR